jgi:hypothetical protein
MPVIFLSADRDPKTIAEAYTLGANCFLSKLPRSRSVFKELKSLYDCWFETAFLPPEAPVDPVRDLLAKAVSLRSRSADLCNRLARAFVREPEVLGFWLDRALSECNLANICAFLLSIVITTITGAIDPDGGPPVSAVWMSPITVAPSILRMCSNTCLTTFTRKLTASF